MASGLRTRVVDAVERVTARAADADELHEDAASLFGDLARGDASAATLRSATSDRPMRSARYRDFLQPQGYDDELRVVFRTAGKSWGVGGLFREPGRALFNAEDVALMEALSPIVAA